MLHLAVLVFLSVSCSFAHSATSQAARKTQALACQEQLDALVSLTSNEQASPEYMSHEFAQLELECPALPQLAHNQGVLAAQAQRWPDAIAHFQRSLALDPRAAMTHRHLQEIFEYRAAQAYARALNTPIDVNAPVLRLQNSGNRNADAGYLQSGKTALHSIATLEYEMFAWWQSLNSAKNLQEHYVDEYPYAAISLSKQKYADQPWDDMQREIAFTASDAVVILSDPYHNRTLFLLRLVGTRWKIYQETDL